jgi:hypothetical protein
MTILKLDARQQLKKDIRDAKTAGQAKATVYIATLERLVKEFEDLERTHPWAKKELRA